MALTGARSGGEDPPPEPQTLMLAVVGSPYESDLCTTLLRMVAAALARGLRVVVWTCGGATTLTLGALAQRKPRNILEIGSERSDCVYPTTAAVVDGLLQSGDGRLRWLVCRHCSEERGAGDQIASVKVVAPLHFRTAVEAADYLLVMGVK